MSLVELLDGVPANAMTFTFHDVIDPSSYYPGDVVHVDDDVTTVRGRLSRFTIDLPGVGTCHFTSVEDTHLDTTTHAGETYGSLVMILETPTRTPIVMTSETCGCIYPDIVRGKPAMAFSGWCFSLGNGAGGHVDGDYRGYFLPDDPLRPCSGELHMEIRLRVVSHRRSSPTS
jgi:hypothetical protein